MMKEKKQKLISSQSVLQSWDIDTLLKRQVLTDSVILKHIIRYLTIGDIISFSCTCKELIYKIKNQTSELNLYQFRYSHRIQYENLFKLFQSYTNQSLQQTYQYKRITFNEEKLNQDEETQRDNDSCILKGDVISIQSINLKSCYKVNNKSMLLISKYFANNLIELNIEGLRNITDQGIIHLYPIMKQLQRLNIRGCFRLTKHSILSILSKCIDLLELNLDGIAINENILIQISKHKTLQVISLGGCIGVTDTGLLPIVSNKSLQQLNLAYCCKIEDQSIITLSSNSVNTLTSINLYGLNKITDKSLKALTQCRKLQSIVLSSCSRITDKGVIDLVQNQDSKQGHNELISIDISMLNQITDLSIIEITKNCAMIRFIGAYGCDLLTVESIHSIIKNSLNIKEIDFNGCPLISSDVLNNLSSKHKDKIIFR
jgi:hypothetical protein